MGNVINRSVTNVMTVSQLNRASNQLLSEHFFSVWVEGEVSNFSAPSSGHWYFSLKDAHAQVRCALFKNQQHRRTEKPQNGQHVIVKAQVSLYEPRGDYQLIVESLEDAGEGLLRKAFEQLKQKLIKEGLFDLANKKNLPDLPHTIGVITSPTGAAIKDILSVLKRRFPLIPVIIYPVAVQGEQAKFEIVEAIVKANSQPLCDVLILARGGGSLEDLWSFNEELVARAIFNSRIPIISAIGHETDITIADFVADLRAATPSAAAENAVPDQRVWLTKFLELDIRLQQRIKEKLSLQVKELSWLQTRLQQQHPGQRVMRNAQRLDEAERRLQQAILLRIQHSNNIVSNYASRLWQFNPVIKLNRYQQQYSYLDQRLQTAIIRRLEKVQQYFLHCQQTLHAVSPLATLNRGYALAINEQNNQIIRSVNQVKLQDRITIRLGQGSISAEVKKLSTDEINTP